MAGALTEARHLYVVASGILGEFEQGNCVRVLDVGLGLGYNALATVDAWLQSGAKAHLQILSLENDEALFHALRSGDAAWQTGWDPFWIRAMKGLRRKSDNIWHGAIQGPGGGRLDWRVMLGDARSDASLSLIQSSGPHDYVWQDPFSPKKNPGMWTADWFSAVALAVGCDGCLMTYSVARKVRDALEVSGWRVEKIPTTSHKKNWLRAFRLARVGDPT
jgi:tRNA U34 5-methylaminomethyl-2-thiouridine-forming methyltransferase MnmC